MWTRERRLALFGARLLRVILVLSVLVFLFVLIFEVQLAYQAATGNFGGVEITFFLPAKLTIARSAYTISAGGVFQLTAPAAGLVVLWSDMPIAARLLVALSFPCAYAFCVYIVFSLQRIFASFAAGRPFQSASVHALRLIAWVLVVQYLADQIARLLSYWLLRRVEVSGEVSVLPPALLGVSSSLNLVVGVVLLLIAWAFSLAAVTEQERDALQEEQNLTV